jgi:phosphoribosyl 1,2-cyclic phosphate phosphodiesterase
MRLVVLGSGTSHGIPVIACSCSVCRSADPRDARFRSSLLVEGAGGERILVDAGPEFRLQAVRAGLSRLDALLLTHAHADHVHGLDDVRPLTRLAPLPVYGNRPTLEELRDRFSYIFRETQKGGGKPSLDLREVSPEAPGRGSFAVGSVALTPIPAKHGRLDILGWRIEEHGRAAAYLTDVSAIPRSSFSLLEGLDVLIIGALRVREHETHFNFDQALDAIAAARPGKAFLSHLCHDSSHAEIEAFIQARERRNGIGYRTGPAWDGMVVDL